MARIDKNRVQQLIKELKDIAVPNHQYKYWKLKENLTQEKLINLENLLVKESRKTRKGDYKWNKEIKEALRSLYPWLHPCCFLRNVREALNSNNYYQQTEKTEITWQEKIERAKKLTQLAEKEVEEAEHLRIREATSLLFNNPQEFFKDVKRAKQ
jgi:hypothetical protein